jgi:serine/threonine protein kinase/sugar lactone lactonase YvrE
MTLPGGFRFGSYEVLSLLGVGGMGEVYRARDLKLQRDVALKILPDEFSLDPDRCARFEREARILAALSHPTIAAIHGIEDSPRQGVDAAAGSVARALVLELVEGPTLADELAGSALPIARAFNVARQIAEALEAAHERGIVHRDLKPANVKIRADGVVKVLDFGLAKALDTTAAMSGDALPRTRTPALTEVGTLFGTPAYMSPEQVRGRAADHRSDIWAFGCVLYEMLTGRPPFAGDDPADVVAAVLRSEPDWSALPPNLPAAARRLLRRCLEKDRARRLRDIGDARLDLDEALAEPKIESTPARAVPRRERIAWLAMAIALAALAAFGAARFTASQAPTPQELRLDVTTPETTSPASFALSPDSSAIVFSALGPRGPQLWVRELASTVAQPLAGTEDGQYPFWSPDGRSIGFFTLNALKRVDVDGGRAQTLVPTVTPGGGAWGPDGTILYVPMDNGGVFRVPVTGGTPSRVTPDPPPSTLPLATRAPQFLPDGRHFLFYVALEDESAGVYVGNFETRQIRRILVTDTPASYGAGHLWYVNDATLFAQPFDAETLELSGSVTRIADDVSLEPAVAGASTSVAGPIAYRSGARTLRRQLLWFDRAGRQLGAVGDDYLRINNPALSPDERQLLAQQTVRQNVDVWLFDLDREVPTRLTVSPTVDSIPLWAPDGSRFALNTTTQDGRAIVIRSLDGSRADERLAQFTNAVTIPTSWSPDGTFVLASTLDAAAGTWDLVALPFGSERTAVQLTETPPYDERNAEFSPDGKWFLFESNESGAPEIYLRAFPGPGPKMRVSTNGGRQPRWRRDGGELFYIAPDAKLMAVPVDRAGDQPSFGTPVPLFQTRPIPTTAINRQQYVVSSDGERFLMVTAEEAPTPPITILMNWQPPAR